jgi:hypothetical protein
MAQHHGYVIEYYIDGFGYLADSQNPGETFVFSQDQVDGQPIEFHYDGPRVDVLFHLGEDGKVNRVVPIPPDAPAARL